MMSHPYIGNIRSLAALVTGLSAILLSATAASAQTQSSSPETQVLTLVAQAEHIDGKCDAFTHEGQFVYREMKARMLNGFNEPVFDSISRRIAPEFVGSCQDLANRSDVRERVTYFNNLGEHMLALHHFLPAGSKCPHANTPDIRKRAEAAWKRRQARTNDPVTAAGMLREAAMLDANCSTLGREAEPSAHIATTMSRNLMVTYQRGPKFGGEMKVKGNHTEFTTELLAFRDPARLAVKNGIIAGEIQDAAPLQVGKARLTILTDGRFVLMMLADGNPSLTAVSFKTATADYPASRIAASDATYSGIFILDQSASKALLTQGGLQPTFTVKLVDSSGNASFWEETYTYQGRRKGDRGTSTRPLRFDPVAFRNALQYCNAPKFP